MKPSKRLGIVTALTSLAGLAATLGVALAPSPARAELRAVGTTSTFDVISVDLDSIERGQSSRGGWWFLIYQVNSPSTIRSTNGLAGYQMLWWTDCSGASMWQMNGMDADWNMVTSQNTSGQYAVPPRGSLMDSALDVVCR